MHKHITRVCNNPSHLQNPNSIHPLPRYIDLLRPVVYNTLIRNARSSRSVLFFLDIKNFSNDSSQMTCPGTPKP